MKIWHQSFTVLGDLPGYEDAMREKLLGNNWEDWLLEQWYHANPRMAVLTGMYDRRIAKGKAMEIEGHRRTGLARAIFDRYEKQYLAQHEQKDELLPEPENQ